MLFSTIIAESNITQILEIRNEIEFDSLGLVTMKYPGILGTFLDTKQYVDQVQKEKRMLLITPEIEKEYPHFHAVVVENPRLTFFQIHNYLKKHDQEYVRKPFPSTVGENCKIHERAWIAKENVVIGNDVCIEEFVSIKENTTIADHVTIRAGSVIGGEGFEVKRTDSATISVSHAGGVALGEHVEIQQNTCVDQAIYPWDDTVIGPYCKLANQINVSHGVKIGRETLIAASTFIGGRTHIGEKVWIGPGATVINNIEIGNGAKVSLGAVVTKEVEENQRVTGNFALPHKTFLEQLKQITKISKEV